MSECKKPEEKRSFHIKIKYYAFMPILFFSLLLLFLFVAILKSTHQSSSFAFYLILFLVTVVIEYIYIKYIFLFLIKLERFLKDYANGDEVDPLAQDTLIRPFSNVLLQQIKSSLGREYVALINKKQAEVNALQSQINPHFLYNTLDCIRGKALLDNVPEIANMTESLANFFRYSISRKGNMVTLSDELKNIDTYIEIQKFRFGDRFEVIKDFEATNVNDIIIPKLTLQPIVENAIYHGIELSERKGYITIKIVETTDRVLLRISDNGVGMDKEKLEELNRSMSDKLQLTQDSTQTSSQGSIAIKNVSDRIKLCFGESYGIVVYSIKGIGTDVEVRIPLIHANDDSNSSIQ